MRYLNLKRKDNLFRIFTLRCISWAMSFWSTCHTCTWIDTICSSRTCTSRTRSTCIISTFKNIGENHHTKRWNRSWITMIIRNTWITFSRSIVTFSSIRITRTMSVICTCFTFVRATTIRFIRRFITMTVWSTTTLSRNSIWISTCETYDFLFNFLNSYSKY